MVWLEYMARTYPMYGSKHEAETCGEVVKHLYEATEGCYLETTERQCVPCTGTEEVSDSFDTFRIVWYPGNYVRLKKPEYRTKSWDELGRVWFNKALFDFYEYELPSWMKLVAERVALGMPLLEAIEHEIRRPTNGNTYKSLENKLIRNRAWKHYLIAHTEGSMSLREKLEEKGLGIDFLVDKVGEVLKGDKKQPVAVQLWALNMIEKAVSPTEKQPLFQQNTYNVGLPAGQSAVGSLPEYVPEAEIVKPLELTDGDSSALEADYASKTEKRGTETSL